jgi:hypothetical protein
MTSGVLTAVIAAFEHTLTDQYVWIGLSIVIAALTTAYQGNGGSARACTPSA